MRKIIKDFGNCIISETMLSNPQPGFNAVVYFTVKIKDEEKDIWFETYTNAIGTTRGIIRPHFSELNNKRVRVAYNKATNKVVVLKILN